jgi:phage shock protein PspC (stress-responsive transcriptional regulator)
MEKIVNINLGNFAFVIDEPAYQKLKNYLEALDRHFQGNEGKAEIIADIESRIAELFSKKISGLKRVITLADVEEVIGQMGNPIDIAGEPKEDSSEKQEPSSYHYRRTGSRRIYRDTDDHVIGGVCSGIGHYIGVDPVWLRIAFAISFFVFGSGFLIYIILWIAIPEAKTAAEKLEMRGETIDINNIEKTIRENINRVKNNFENIYESTGKQKFKQGSRQFGNYVSAASGALGKGIVKIIGASFIFFSAIVLTWLLSTFIFNHQNQYRTIVAHLFEEDYQIVIASASVALLISIPLIALLIVGLRMLLDLQIRIAPLKYISAALSLAAIIGIVYSVVYLANGFQDESKIKETKASLLPLDSTIYINFEIDDHFDGRDYRVGINHQSLFYKDGDDIRFGNIDLEIKKSPNDSFMLVCEKVSSGADAISGHDLCKKIKTKVYGHDSVLTLANYGIYSAKFPWRAQRIHYKLYVPENKKIYFSELDDHMDIDCRWTAKDDDDDAELESKCFYRMTSGGLTVIKKP